MKAFILCCLCYGLVMEAFGRGAAWAQSDGAIPYPDAEYDDEPLRRKTKPRLEVEDAPSLAHTDDPSKGLNVEGLGGVLFLASTRGAGWVPRATGGARLTWELGRLLSNELLHDGLFLDGTWLTAGQKEGTSAVATSAKYHLFTLAPALGVSFGPGGALGIYGQVGGGFAYQSAQLESAGTIVSVEGVKGLLQYGLGFRFRPVVDSVSGFHLNGRLELTRFRRGYLDDTLVALSLGAGF